MFFESISGKACSKKKAKDYPGQEADIREVAS
jgi:hypothetical protein